MQTVTPTADRYSFDGLGEPARSRALQAIQQAHPCRWDVEDIDQAAAAMARGLTAAFGTPLPGQLDVEVTVWDADRFSLAGVLEPDTAPALPWNPAIHAITIARHRRVHVHTTKPTADSDTIRAIVYVTIASVWQATHRQMEHRQALEWIAACEPRFTASGHLLFHTCATGDLTRGTTQRFV